MRIYCLAWATSVMNSRDALASRSRVVTWPPLSVFYGISRATLFLGLVHYRGFQCSAKRQYLINYRDSGFALEWRTDCQVHMERVCHDSVSVGLLAVGRARYAREMGS